MVTFLRNCELHPGAPPGRGDELPGMGEPRLINRSIIRDLLEAFHSWASMTASSCGGTTGRVSVHQEPGKASANPGLKIRTGGGIAEAVANALGRIRVGSPARIHECSSRRRDGVSFRWSRWLRSSSTRC